MTLSAGDVCNGMEEHPLTKTTLGRTLRMLERDGPLSHIEYDLLRRGAASLVSRRGGNSFVPPIMPSQQPEPPLESAEFSRNCALPACCQSSTETAGDLILVI